MLWKELSGLLTDHCRNSFFGVFLRLKVLIISKTSSSNEQTLPYFLIFVNPLPYIVGTHIGQ